MGSLYALLQILIPLQVLLHVLGALAFPRSAWGLHAYAFWPGPVLWGSLVLLLLALWTSRTAQSALPARLNAVADNGRLERIPPALLGLTMTVASLALFWVARIRHTMLGDGNVILVTLPESGPVHVRQPLCSLAAHHAYGLMRHFLAPETPSYEIAQSAMALYSIVAGAFFVLLAWRLSHELLRGGPASPTKLRANHPAVVLLAAVLVAQGDVQLYFGYVEFYSLYLTALAIYVWGSLRFLQGRAPFALPALAALLSIGMHLSGAIVLPSLLLLLIKGLRTPGLRRAVLRDVGACAVAAVAMSWILSRLASGYNVFAVLIDLSRGIAKGSGGDFSYLFSAKHLQDFVQEQLLIGPLGLALFLPALIVWLRRRSTVIDGFWLLLGLSYLFACWVAGDSNLGYARNWDLLAPSGFVFTIAAFGLVWQRPPDTRTVLSPLCMALALSLFHTVPWIALNAVEPRALERMKSLPLGGGRTEMVVGNWYLRHEEYTSAAAWLDESIRKYPFNVAPYYLLGMVHSRNGDLQRARDAFQHAVDLRATPVYRRELAETLVRLQQFPEAVVQFRALEQLNAMRPQDWLRYGEALRASGSANDREVFERARVELAAAVQDNPHDYGLRIALGWTLEHMDSTQAAAQVYRRASTMAPDSVRAWFHLGALLVRSGDAETAQPQLQRALELETDPERRARIKELMQR